MSQFNKIFGCIQQFNYVITDEIGIHARPAGMLAKEAKAFSSKIKIEANGKAAEATKLMAVMQLGVKKVLKLLLQLKVKMKMLLSQK